VLRVDGEGNWAVEAGTEVVPDFGRGFFAGHPELNVKQECLQKAEKRAN
jgi:hypothetical protein